MVRVQSFSIIGGNDIAIKPDEKAIDRFWDEANAALPDLRADHQVRWIGLDEETTLEIIAYIRSGEKSATYTVPWINANYGWPDGSPGLPIILLGFDGLPAIMVETTDVIKINFGDIGSDLSGLDGPPVRTSQFGRIYTQCTGMKFSGALGVNVRRTCRFSSKNSNPSFRFSRGLCLYPTSGDVFLWRPNDHRFCKDGLMTKHVPDYGPERE